MTGTRVRLMAALPVAAVAAVAGIISYTHIYRLALAEGQTPFDSRLFPFAVDGLIVAGSVALYRATSGQPWLGWLGVGPGVLATLYANVESGISRGVLAAIVAGWPAIAFALASFLFEQSFKPGRGQIPATVAMRGQCGHVMTGDAESVTVGMYLHQRDCLGVTPSMRQLSATSGLSRHKVAGLVGALAGSGAAA